MRIFSADARHKKYTTSYGYLIENFYFRRGKNKMVNNKHNLNNSNDVCLDI